MADLIEQCQLAYGELIEVTGRAAIEPVLHLSGNQAAGTPATTEQAPQRKGSISVAGKRAG